MDKYFCLECKKELNDNKNKCKRGGKVILSGDIKLDDDSIKCICNNQTWKLDAHLDGTGIYINTYTCKNCGNHMSAKVFKYDIEVSFVNLATQ